MSHSCCSDSKQTDTTAIEGCWTRFRKAIGNGKWVGTSCWDAELPYCLKAFPNIETMAAQHFESWRSVCNSLTLDLTHINEARNKAPNRKSSYYGWIQTIIWLSMPIILFCGVSSQLGQSMLLSRIFCEQLKCLQRYVFFTRWPFLQLYSHEAYA